MITVSRMATRHLLTMIDNGDDSFGTTPDQSPMFPCISGACFNEDTKIRIIWFDQVALRGWVIAIVGWQQSQDLFLLFHRHVESKPIFPDTQSYQASSAYQVHARMDDESGLLFAHTGVKLLVSLERCVWNACCNLQSVKNFSRRITSWILAINGFCFAN